jgi:dipeptidyl aminopeptidase/acylaminoacyl peptidase
MRTGLRAGRVVAVLAVISSAIVCTPVAARPYVVEDIVHQESFGTVAISPTGRWLIYERRISRMQAPQFTNETRHDTTENQLRVVDLSRPGKPRPLLAGDPVGITMGPYSPDGVRLAVYGRQGDRWRLGVVKLSTGTVRWLPVNPEFPYRTRTVQWRSSTQLAAIARPADAPPLILTTDAEGPRLLPTRWSQTAHGELAVSALGSGRYFEQRPHKLPSHLVLVNVESGRTSVLAGGDIEDLEIAPDGRHIAFVEAGPDVRLHADTRVNGPSGTAWHRERLGIADAETGRVVRPAAHLDLAGQLLSWSPSGREVLVFARADGEPWSNGRPLRVTAEGEVKALDLGDGVPVLSFRPEVARAIWLGEIPAILVQRQGRRDWVADIGKGARVLTAGLSQAPETLQPTLGGALGVVNGELWRLSATGAEAVKAPLSVRMPAARALWEMRLVANPPVPVEHVVLQRSSGGRSFVVAIDGAGLGAEVALPDRDSRVAAMSPGGKDVASLTDDEHGVGRLRLWTDGRWIELDAVNLRQHDVDPLRAVPVRVEGAAGSGATLSWLYLPQVDSKGSPPPLVVVPYPGQRHDTPATLATYGISSAAPSIPAIVGAGYAVLSPSLPLGEAAEPALDLAKKVLTIVDAAMVQHPGAFDPQRLALWGHSFGGYGTAAIITQTDRFGAAVDMAGPIDLISMWGTFLAPMRINPSEGSGIAGEQGWTEDSQGAMGAPPWRDPARYLRNSPIFQANLIHTPLLIIAGDLDHIPETQGEEMFSALFRQDRDAMLLTYWGEGHLLYSPANVRDAYRRSFAWLADNLDRRLSAGAGRPASPAPASATSEPSSR